MIRRCYFLSGTWSDSSVSSHFRALSQELARRGHTVVFIVDRQNQAIENHDGNPAVYTWPSSRPTRLHDAIFLRRLVKKYKPDCMLSAFGATNVTIVVGWWMRVPARATWYFTLSDGIRLDSRLPKWNQHFLRLRKRFVYALATHIVPNSMAGCEDVQRVYKVPAEKCRVMYLSMSDPKRRMPGLGVSTPINRTICAGRFDPVKGQDVLLRAIAKLRDRFSDTEFEFVGDGPCRDECERLAAALGIADQCRFVGRLTHDELLRRMAHSTVTVVPSRFECFGLVNLDSLATGTPVIASDVGGIGEIIDDGEQGYLVPPDDPDSLAERLAAILGDPELRKRMSQKALERFKSFEQSRVVVDQVSWLESLLNHKNNGQRQSCHDEVA